MPSRAVRRPSGSASDRLDSRRRLLAKIAMNRRKADGRNPRLRAMERTRSRGSRSLALCLLRRPHVHHRDFRSRQPAASSAGRTYRRNQDRHLMSANTTSRIIARVSPSRRSAAPRCGPMCTHQRPSPSDRRPNATKPSATRIYTTVSEPIPMVPIVMICPVAPLISCRPWRQVGGTIAHCKGCLTDQPPRRNTTLAASRPARPRRYCRLTWASVCSRVSASPLFGAMPARSAKTTATSVRPL
jgi:hypothetical protein